MFSKFIDRFKKNSVNMTFRVLISILMVVPLTLFVICEFVADKLSNFSENVVLFTNKTFPVQKND